VSARDPRSLPPGAFALSADGEWTTAPGFGGKRKRPRTTIIHVNQHVIRRNGKTGERNPTLTVKQGKRNRYAQEVIIEGPSRVVYRPDKPLSCGAKVWIATESPVTLVGERGVPARACAVPKARVRS